jgi:SAM-dependent methyltransferase
MSSSLDKNHMQKPAAASGPSRWALNSYPAYVSEVDRSINFSGLTQDHFTRGKAERLISHLKQLNPSINEIRILDIGCGQGLIHPYIRERGGLRLTGVDVAADALQVARAVNPDVNYKTYDGANLPFLDASFDVAFTICVMHHVPPQQWSSFVAEAKRILRPGGVFLIFEHNPWNPLTRLAVRRCPFDYDAVLLSAPRIRGLMGASGFVHIQQEFIFFTPFSAPAVKRLELMARWFPFGAQHVSVGCKPT